MLAILEFLRQPFQGHAKIVLSGNAVGLGPDPNMYPAFSGADL